MSDKEKSESIEGDWAKSSDSNNGLVIQQGGTQQFYAKEDIERVLDPEDSREWIRGVIYPVQGNSDSED